MIVERFEAEPDLVARRVRVTWTLTPEAGETLADAPRQVLRRKTRDFEFVQPFPVPDPYLVYDSAAFPPPPLPGLTVTELPPSEAWADGQLTAYETVSIADEVGGRPLERMRRIVATTYASDGQPLQRRIELIDSGAQPLSLEPGVAVYYQLFSPAFTPAQSAQRRAVATPAAPHGLNRTMYELLPAVHRRFDVVLRPATPGADSIPEAFQRSGQLRRLLDVYGAVMDGARSSAENLWTLHDVDRIDGRWLPRLAHWMGWRLGDADALPLARSEVKATPRLYETVGTVTAVRALVTRYTGWSTQVAEFVQHLARANDAPRRNLWAAVDAGGMWRSPLDVAARLGFGPGNDEAFGVGANPATLTGGLVEPFALYAGAELSIALDAGPEFRVRFGTSAFVDPAAASAAEVAAAIAESAGELVASVAAGRIVLSSRSIGPQAQLNVIGRVSEPLTLDCADRGRPAVAIDLSGRVRVFGAETTPTHDPQRRAGERGIACALVCKTWVEGQWRGAQRLPVTRAAVRTGVDSLVGYPAAATIADGRCFLAWVDAPHSRDAQMRWTLGSARAPQPALLQGRIGTRFALVPGTRMTLSTAAGPEVFNVVAADYVLPAQATAAEVVAAMNAQLVQAVASVGADGTLRLTSTALGPGAVLAVDLALSNAARALGFVHAATEVRGHWDETLDCSAAWPIERLGSARPTGLAVLAQGDGVRVTWSAHERGRWRLQQASWVGPRTAIATALGLALLDDAGGSVVLDAAAGLPSDTVRDALPDAEGAWWIATDAGLARRRPDGTWVLFDAVAGLPSDDTRRLLLSIDGAIWAATAAGLGRVSAGGAVSALTTLDGLADDDVRSLVRAPDGSLWIATGAGLSRLASDGSFANVGLPQLPSLDVRDVAIDAEGRVYAATAAGTVERDALGMWRALPTPVSAGLDHRGLAVGRQGLWLATGAGLWRRAPDGAWQGYGLAQGLPSVDLRRVGEDERGGAWVATPAGAVRIGDDGAVEVVDTLQGLPSDDVAGWCSAWSAAADASDGGEAVGARGDADPFLLREADGNLLLLWSRWLAGAPGEDRRALRARRFDPMAHAWGGVVDVTTPPGAEADAQPAGLALPLPAGGARIFFTSNRGGGDGLWEMPLDAALVAGPENAIEVGAGGRTAPMPVSLPDGLWLLHRSEDWIAPDQLPPVLAGAAPPAVAARVPEAATLRRHCGSTTPVMADLARNGRRLQWGDLLAYTPHRPLAAPGEPPLEPHECFTRGTLGLYVTRGRFGQPLTAANAARLRQLLAEFLPINLRAVIVLAPSLLVELAGTGLADSYADSYPFVEVMNAIADTSAAALPDWSLLFTNDPAALAADPVNLATLRRRTWYPPPL